MTSRSHSAFCGQGRGNDEERRPFPPGRIASSFDLAVALDSTVDGFLLLWLDAPERHPFPENPDTILDIFFKGRVDS
jgi:hypothetical protein